MGRTALAGGGALLAHGLVSRPTADVDLFTPDEQDVRRLHSALVDALLADGLTVETSVDTVTFVRLGVRDEAGGRLEVEIARDARLALAVAARRPDEEFHRLGLIGPETDALRRLATDWAVELGG